MAEERAKNYIERLPEIIERPEKDISHLDPRMVEILYPERASRESTVTVVFPTFDGPQGGDAVALAERALRYRREGADREARHYATYSLDQANDLYRLYDLVGNHPDSELLLNDKKVPYVRELWLPFFWLFRHDAETA
jgi:hypothetical protein